MRLYERLERISEMQAGISLSMSHQHHLQDRSQLVKAIHSVQPAARLCKAAAHSFTANMGFVLLGVGMWALSSLLDGFVLSSALYYLVHCKAKALYYTVR